MRAEYDLDNNRVVMLEMDDGRQVLTHNPRVLGARTEVIPVDVEYPEGYDPRFHQLLRPASVRYDYDAVSNRVVVRYPEADFSPGAVREALRAGVNEIAQVRLRDTDWYFIRELETGEPVPDEVRAERASLRAAVDERKVELEQTPDEALSSFQFDVTAERPNPVQAEPETAPIAGGDGTEWVTDATSPDVQGNPYMPVEEAEVNQPLRDAAFENPKTGLPWEL